MTPLESSDRSDALVHVAVAVVVRPSEVGSPKILIGHRFPNVHLPDYWEFPGGKIEPGEASEVCARREVLEETGVEVEVCGLLTRQRHEYPDRKVEIDFHVCRYVSGIAAAIHCQAVRWVDPGRLDAYPFPNANEEVLSLLQREGWIGP